jgi:hypothetical protein
MWREMQAPGYFRRILAWFARILFWLLMIVP